MKKYIITFNCGFGENHEVVKAESLEEAQKEAYEAWLEEAEAEAEYYAEEWTEEAAYDYDLLTEAEAEEHERKMDGDE